MKIWLQITLAWLLFTTGFGLWIWAFPGVGSFPGLLLVVLTSNYAFTARQNRRELLDRRVGKRDLIAIGLLFIGVYLLALLADYFAFDLKEKLREPLVGLVLYALVVVPVLRRWYRRLTRTEGSEGGPAQAGTEP